MLRPPVSRVRPIAGWPGWPTDPQRQHGAGRILTSSLQQFVVWFNYLQCIACGLRSGRIGTRGKFARRIIASRRSGSACRPPLTSSPLAMRAVFALGIESANKGTIRCPQATGAPQRIGSEQPGRACYVPTPSKVVRGALLRYTAARAALHACRNGRPTPATCSPRCGDQCIVARIRMR